jgi:hypothetical protein
VRIRLFRKRAANERAVVVIAGNDRERQLQRSEQAPQMLVFLRRRRVDQIARADHQLRPRPQAIELDDAALECGGGVDPAIGELSRRLDVQVGNLCD